MGKRVFGDLRPDKDSNRPAQLQKLASLETLDIASIGINYPKSEQQRC